MMLNEWAGSMEQIEEFRRRSRELRKKWAKDIGTGKRTVPEAFAQSGRDGKYIRRTRLRSILGHADGWNADKPTSIRRALIDNGFADDATLQDLSSQAKMRTFEGLLHSTSERWTPRVNFPEKWPFMGKLEEVLGQKSVIPFLPEEMVNSEADRDEDLSEQGYKEATELEMDSILPSDPDESDEPDELDFLLDDLDFEEGDDE